jgi:hypothetical protein
MLVAMEIALGVVLGVLGVALAGLVACVLVNRPRAARPTATPPSAGPGFGDDDLPGFLDSPPGAGSEPAPPGMGWASLTAPPPPPPPASRTPATGQQTRVVLAAMAAAAVLLLGVAAVVAIAGGEHRPSRGSTRHGPTADPSAAPGTLSSPTAGALAQESVPLGADGIATRLTFGGVVLERHPVGVTATYPSLRLTSDGKRSLAHLELPTFHCLADEAPSDPVAAGCSRSVPEYADLGSPTLRLTGSPDRLRLSGDFPTYLRPNGGPPEWTGRVYRLEVTVEAAAGGAEADGWRPAEGVLELGSGRTRTSGEPGVNVLRSGS